MTDFAVVEDNVGIPAPQTVTLAQLAANIEAFESELVRVPNITINPGSDVVFSSARSYIVTDAVGTTFILRVPSASDTGAANTPIPPGPVTFTGVLGEFNGLGQLTLIERTDLLVHPVAGEPPPAPAALALSVGANPVRGEVPVAFALPAAGAVRIGVYDAAGREVAVLLDGDRPAGPGAVTLAAGGLPAGVYVVRLAVRGGAVARTVTVLR